MGNIITTTKDSIYVRKLVAIHPKVDEVVVEYVGTDGVITKLLKGTLTSIMNVTASNLDAEDLELE